MQCNLISDNMMGALYGEADAAALAQLNEHLAVCAACRAEWDELKGVRQDLAEWRLPDLGDRPWRAPQSRRWIPMLAAAATLILSIGGGIGLAKPVVQYDDAGLRISFGGSTDAWPAREASEAQFAAQQARHEQQIQMLTAALAAPGSAAPAPAPAGGGPALDDVRRLIRESEGRLEQRVAVRLADWQERNETQRRYDLARVAASLSYLEGQNGQHMARTTELVGYMLDASQKGQIR